jgi:hypothetical protein
MRRRPIVLDSYNVKSKVLEAIPFVSTHILQRYELEKCGAKFEFLESIMGSMALRLSAYIYGGETRETVKTVEMKEPRSWVDALQISARSKGWLCGGGLIGILLYWWFLDREPQWKTNTATVRFKARELFPTIQDRGHKCVIADWTNMETPCSK